MPSNIYLLYYYGTYIGITKQNNLLRISRTVLLQLAKDKHACCLAGLKSLLMMLYQKHEIFTVLDRYI